MEKWADFVITAVRYNKERTHIDKVKRYEDNGDDLVNQKTKMRQTIVNAIEEGYTYITSIKNENEEWKKGAKIIITEIDGVKYLKTVNDNSVKDNLGNLPEF